MAYFSIRESALNKYAKEGHERAIAEFGDEGKETKDTILFYETPHKISEMNFENGEVSLDIELNTPDGEDLGFVAISTPLDLDIVADIVEYYIKRLNRLKTVLEATKE